MYEGAFSRQVLINHSRTDPLSPGSYPDNWPTKDGGLLRSTPEIKGHSCIRGRHRTHSSTLAPRGLPYRIVWDICAFW